MLVEEKDALKERLKEIFGYSQFRGSQERIIRNLLEGKNTFVIMPTGAGKSLCYQLPAMSKDGLAIVISPLIALIFTDFTERIGGSFSHLLSEHVILPGPL